MRRTIAASLALALAGLLAASPGLSVAQSGSAWPSFHGTGTRSGLGSGNGPTSSTYASQWKLPRGVYSSPVVDASGVGYVGDDDGNVYKLTPGSADPKMLYAAGTQTGLTHFSPNLTLSTDGKTLYVASPTGTLSAVSTSDGKKVWSATISGINSAPVLSNDGATLYIPSTGGTIYELNAGTGAVSCQRPQGVGGIPGSLAISPDGSTVYAATRDGELLVAPSGSQLCTAAGTVLYLTGGTATSSPAVDANGTIYAASGSSLGAIDAFSGGNKTPQWTYQVSLGTIIPSTPAIGAGLVVFGATDGHVYALDSSGKIVWNQATGGSVESSPVIANGNHLIYVANDSGAVEAYDTAGNLVWSRATGSPIVGSLALGPDGTLWAASVSGYVYRFSNLPLPPSNPGAPTPRPTGTVLPSPTPSPTSPTTVLKVPLSVTVKATVPVGKKQAVKIVSAPKTVVHIRVQYPNGDHQSHQVTTNARGKATYTYVQGSSKVFRHRRYAMVVAKAGTGAHQTTAKRKYKIGLGHLDVTAEPRSQAVGKVVNIFIHTRKFTRVMAILKFPTGKSIRRYGKTGKQGWAEIGYRVAKKLIKGKNRRVTVQGWLQSRKPNWHSGTWFTIK